MSCADSQSCAQTKCFSAGNLYKTSNQAKKFCKCATPTHTYGYKSYTTYTGRKTVNMYVDAANNENWTLTTASASSSISAVKCSNGVTYSTGKDYYY